MKALSIKQPWAHYIASGQKTIETRTWETKYRGPLLICAGASLDFGAPGATLLADYNTLYFSCAKGSSGRQPNVVIANSTLYGAFLAALTPQQRFMDANSATSGFKTVKLLNADYIFSSVITSAQDSAWMFNTNDTFLAVAKTAFRKRRAPMDFSAAAMVNQKVFSVLQLGTRNRSRGGVLFT